MLLKLQVFLSLNKLISVCCPEDVSIEYLKENLFGRAFASSLSPNITNESILNAEGCPQLLALQKFLPEISRISKITQKCTRKTPREVIAVVSCSGTVVFHHARKHVDTQDEDHQSCMSPGCVSDTWLLFRSGLNLLAINLAKLLEYSCFLLS